MRVAIASRIFQPESAAASFRLAALADALAAAGHEVEVLTVRPPKRLTEAAAEADTGPYRVKRFPVLRDSSGYVRGYVQYLSFDVPLFFRVLLGRRRDLIVSEPPPTTGFFVRCASALRRTPYAYYAADIWSEASAQTTAPTWVVRAVRRVERFALRGARSVLSVSGEVTARLTALGAGERVEMIGNGVDVDAFRRGLEATNGNGGRVAPVFVYAGTASEWHAAEVFIEAMPEVLRAVPEARLRFIGGGSERENLRARAEELGVAAAVTFEPTMPPELLAPVLRSAAAAVASVRPNSSYEFAFPTKLYSAATCGAPMVYSGSGPTRDFIATRVAGEPLGISVGTDPREVAAAMIDCAERPTGSERRNLVSRWAIENVSLRAVAARAVRALEHAVDAGEKEAL